MDSTVDSLGWTKQASLSKMQGSPQLGVWGALLHSDNDNNPRGGRVVVATNNFIVVNNKIRLCIFDSPTTTYT